MQSGINLGLYHDFLGLTFDPVPGFEFNFFVSLFLLTRFKSEGRIDCGSEGEEAE